MSREKKSKQSVVYLGLRSCSSRCCCCCCCGGSVSEIFPRFIFPSRSVGSGLRVVQHLSNQNRKVQGVAVQTLTRTHAHIHTHWSHVTYTKSTCFKTDKWVQKKHFTTVCLKEAHLLTTPPAAFSNYAPSWICLLFTASASHFGEKKPLYLQPFRLLRSPRAASMVVN